MMVPAGLPPPHLRPPRSTQAPQSTLALTKTADKATYSPGETIIYTLQARAGEAVQALSLAGRPCVLRMACLAAAPTAPPAPSPCNAGLRRRQHRAQRAAGGDARGGAHPRRLPRRLHPRHQRPALQPGRCAAGTSGAGAQGRAPAAQGAAAVPRALRARITPSPPPIRFPPTARLHQTWRAARPPPSWCSRPPPRSPGSTSTWRCCPRTTRRSRRSPPPTSPSWCAPRRAGLAARTGRLLCAHAALPGQGPPALAAPRPLQHRPRVRQQGVASRLAMAPGRHADPPLRRPPPPAPARRRRPPPPWPWPRPPTRWWLWAATSPTPCWPPPLAPTSAA